MQIYLGQALLTACVFVRLRVGEHDAEYLWTRIAHLKSSVRQYTCMVPWCNGIM